MIPVICACFTPGPLLLGAAVHMAVKRLRSRTTRVGCTRSSTGFILELPGGVEVYTRLDSLEDPILLRSHSPLQADEKSLPGSIAVAVEAPSSMTLLVQPTAEEPGAETNLAEVDARA